MSALRKILSQKTDEQLMYYIRHPGKHTEEAVELALEELHNRNILLPDNVSQVIAQKISRDNSRSYIPSKETRNKFYKLSFIYSLSYVGLGTLSVLSLSPSSLFYGDWVIIALLITLLVNLISFGIAYSDGNATGLILIVQSIMFLIFWLILFNVLMSINRKVKKDS
ncbi:hypothetical protein [Pedobacter hiemivivus]|uniref:Uncharacterized protein n=1 Tax=Pedobacter hiemivivus TaxID=2530454 RepID=A0A4R0ND63_9SPHI|nr:hypothetical protein [Pedobacter hiemivivus]TCC97012.1 hypothetical protein EZ444_09135 [Pedobacter hiemivivus]